MPFPSQTDLTPIFDDNGECIRFLTSKGVFYPSLVCEHCHRTMRPMVDRCVFRCPGKDCRKELSLRIHTFFHGSALSCSAIMKLAHMWLADVSFHSVVLLSGHSTKTVASFFLYFRQLVSSSLVDEDCVIGGKDIIVEVDETKMGKRKYNRGRRVEGVWIVGGVEKTSERRLFLATVEDRKRETLIALLSKHIAPGSIIRTDLWKGYLDIDQHMDVEHQTVNHSKWFKDPVTLVHTNTIESTWNALKLRIEPRSRVRDGMDERLMEFIWRRKHQSDLWGAFIDVLRDMHYDV